jgi:hypothetical protein
MGINGGCAGRQCKCHQRPRRANSSSPKCTFGGRQKDPKRTQPDTNRTPRDPLRTHRDLFGTPKGHLFSAHTTELKSITPINEGIYGSDAAHSNRQNHFSPR